MISGQLNFHWHELPADDIRRIKRKFGFVFVTETGEVVTDDEEDAGSSASDDGSTSADGSASTGSVDGSTTADDDASLTGSEDDA